MVWDRVWTVKHDSAIKQIFYQVLNHFVESGEVNIKRRHLLCPLSMVGQDGGLGET